MKRRDDIVVGITILAALAVIVAGALWMSESHLGQGGVFPVARFKTVGGLSLGNPVVMRGVRVGRVEGIRLAEGDWVEAVLNIYPDYVADVELIRPSPAVIAASASLFGEWHVSVISLSESNINDPNVLRDLADAAVLGEGVWPGATLPDIGQLTAQAGRIASDIGAFSRRIETAFDDEAVLHLQSSIRDFGAVASEINEFATLQTEILGEVAGNVRTTSGVISETSFMLQRIMARIDSSTGGGMLDSIVDNTARVSGDLRLAMDDFRQFVAMLNGNSGTIDRVIVGTDSVISRLYEGSGTLARLVGDSSLYVEANLAIQELRALLSDIRENPRKYFKFSVF